MTKQLIFILVSIYTTATYAYSITSIKNLVENNPECQFVNSYITFGDFFSSNSSQIIGINDNHYWTVGFVTNGNCTEIPSLMLTNKSKKKVIQPLYLKPFITDKYKFTFSSNNIGRNNTVGQVYERTSYHFKIIEKHLTDYDIWRPYIELSNNFVTYNFPDLNNYLTESQSASSTKKDLKIFFVADLDLSDTAIPTINRTINSIDKVDIYMHNGDFAYDLFDSNGHKGDGYFSMLNKPYSSKPYIVSLGNHEQLDEFKFFNYRFRMPGGNDDIKTRNNWYSFKIKDIYFVTVNQDFWQRLGMLQKNVFEDRNKILSWMSDDIKNSKNSKFKVFYTHRPNFCGDISQISCNLMIYFQKPFEDFLMMHKFDLALFSHVHSYTRMTKMSSFKTIFSQSSPISIGNEFKAPLYIMAGHSGNIQKSYNTYNRPTESTIVNTKVITGKDANYLNININRNMIAGELRDSKSNILQDYWVLTSQKIIDVDSIGKSDKNLGIFEWAFWITIIGGILLQNWFIIERIRKYCINSRERNKKSIDNLIDTIELIKLPVDKKFSEVYPNTTHDSQSVNIYN